MDVVALYLSERSNNTSYYTLEKLIFSVCIYIYLFVRTFFDSKKKNLSNAATREKKENSLIVRFFIFMKVQSITIINYFFIVQALQNSKNFGHLLFSKCAIIRARQHGLAVLASSTPILSLLVFIITIVFGLEVHMPRTYLNSMERKLWWRLPPLF